MDEDVARLRLESMLTDLDRSLVALAEQDPDEVIVVVTHQRTAVLAALKRLDDGLYGRCLDCGRLVPDGRLEARPEAARCVSCQSKLERRR